MNTDQLVSSDNWSDLSSYQAPPEVDQARLDRYRADRICKEMRRAEVDLCIMTNPVSLRYAIDLRSYSLFTAHIPSTYLFFNQSGEWKLHNAFAPSIAEKNMGQGVPISYMYGGDELVTFADQFAGKVEQALHDIGQDKGRVAVEYINPTIVQALEHRGIEVVDGVVVTERARLIKSVDEVNCIRWAIAVAELGAAKVREALKPGVTENQLWGLLNYTNQANDGDWHDGRMLASGPRINPWLQEATPRKVEAGDLVGFDTDMVGPMGYCADLSRTLFCGRGRPSERQKELYRYAMDEIEHNLGLVKSGVSFQCLQDNAWPVPEAFRQNAYPCILHGVGMCDEFPHIHPGFRGELPYQGQLEAGMVVCIESYIGAVGERDGVKLEQQVLVTDSGYELLTHFPFEDAFL